MILLLLLSLAIILHELGHFIVAKCFGVRVERFFLFFDPGFCLYSTGKRFSTEFRVGWLPLGGYMRFQSSEGEEQPKWSLFAQHPAKRLAVFLAGVIVNLTLAYGSLFAWARYYYYPESEYSNVYVMEKTIRWSVNIMDDCRIRLAELYVPKVSGESDDNTSTATIAEQNSGVKKETYTNRFFPTRSMINDTDLAPRRLLWKFGFINLAFFLLNLLPIPPLDGAQCLFAVYEWITRKPLNEKIRLILSLTGMAIIFGALCFDILSDIYHFIM